MTASDQKRSVRPKRWQVALVALVLMVCAASLLLMSRKKSRRYISLDVRNWRVYVSESVEFDPSGAMLRSVKGYHLGPVVISSEHAWTENKAPVSYPTNGRSSLRRIYSAKRCCERQHWSKRWMLTPPESTRPSDYPARTRRLENSEPGAVIANLVS